MRVIPIGIRNIVKETADIRERYIGTFPILKIIAGGNAGHGMKKAIPVKDAHLILIVQDIGMFSLFAETILKIQTSSATLHQQTASNATKI